LIFILLLKIFGEPAKDGELRDELNGEFIGELRLLLILESTGLEGLVLILNGVEVVSLPLPLFDILLLLNMYDEEVNGNIALTDKCLVLLLLLLSLTLLENDLFLALSFNEKVLVTSRTGLEVEAMAIEFILF
jgi:hypothetical protein